MRLVSDVSMAGEQPVWLIRHYSLEAVECFVLNDYQSNIRPM